MEAVERVLKPHGSVMIVIRSHIKKGAVSPYVLHTRLLLQQHGWGEPGEMIWLKPDGMPTGRKDRCRQSHESILWFSKNPDGVYCDPKANGRIITRMAALTGGVSGNGKGFSSVYRDFKRSSVPRSKSVRLGLIEESLNLKAMTTAIARCPDVVRAAVSGCNRSTYNDHVAQHPAALYRWMIRLGCPPGGTVLDPFAGSGTTMEASFLEDRQSISIEKETKYVDIIRRRLHDLGR